MSGYRDYPSRAQRVHRLAMRITGTPVSDLERLGGELAGLEEALTVACDELDLLAQMDRELDGRETQDGN